MREQNIGRLDEAFKAKKDQRKCEKNNPSSLGTAMTAAALQQHLSLSLGLSSRTSLYTSKERNKKRRKEPEKAQCRHQHLDNVSKHREYVLDEPPPPLTLAQMYGLAEQPKKVLTEEEWASLKEQSIKRGEHTAPCVICKEDFGLNKQVLLSCSHVFHKDCLKAFERFSGRKNCPMCRRKEYETRVIYEGAKVHRYAAAARIQAVWRGYKVRKWYENYRSHHPPSHPKLRTKYYQKKLESLTQEMVNIVDSRTSAAESLCQDIDIQIERSRQIMKTAELAISLTSYDWESVKQQALERGDTNCPICISSMEEIRRPIVLLTCSHVYHATCLEMFENLTTDVSVSCPVCRAQYLKRSFIFV